MAKIKAAAQKVWRSVQSRVAIGAAFLLTKKIVSIVTIAALVAFASGISIQPVYSAGLTVTATNTDSSTAAAETRISVVFTPATALVATNTIKIYLGTNTGGVPFTDGDADQSGADIACVQTGSTFNTGAFAAASATVPMLYSMTVATASPGTAAVTCTIGSLSTDGPNLPATPDGYSVAVVTTSDTGAGIDYVGSANLVTVSAQVLPNLTLTIGAADGTVCVTTSSVTACNMGVLTTAAVSTGTYSVKVGTNAQTGATLQVKDDGDLRSASLQIDDITEDTTVAAGTEGNGIAVTAGTGWTETSPFNDDDTPTTSSNQTVATTAAPVAVSGTTDVDITHRVAVSNVTQSANYSQIMTWTATATF